MIARRGGHDAVRQFFIGQRHDLAQRAAWFERAGVLAILLFEINIKAGACADRSRSIEWRAADKRLDALSSEIDIVQGKFGHEVSSAYDTSLVKAPVQASGRFAFACSLNCRVSRRG